MLIVLSPAKSLDFESKPMTRRHTQPRLAEQAGELIEVMATKSPEEIARLMSVSPDLADLNWQRFQDWSPEPDIKSARQAILAFKGDTYMGFNVARFGARDLTAAQRRVRILSGLHGVLRPLDLIQPYRLEMGTRLETARGKNLYEYWGDTITASLSEDLEAMKPRTLVNLASVEYFKSVHPDMLDARIVTPRFEDYNGGEYRVVSFFAKRARGALASWLVMNRVKTLRGMQDFVDLGYRYDADRSTRNQPIFVRDPR